MDDIVIAYDLGTGGIKSSAVSVEGKILFSTFISYPTFFPKEGWQEQAPDDWWNALVESTKLLLESGTFDKKNVKALAISGHSLGVVPIDKNGKLLRNKTPIWSDKRAEKEAEDFFYEINNDEWYNITGNGFPAACYPLFKIAWYKNNEPDVYNNAYKIIGTKDYCNYKLTGRICTDYSYASGYGAYSLKDWSYRYDFMNIADVSLDLFPEILSSDAVVGCLTLEAAKLLGLNENVKVVCGGVDNSCMALGAKGITNGRSYTSLGSSAWIASITSSPILDNVKRPYVFAHVIKGMYTSASCIFSACTSLSWVIDMFLSEYKNKECLYKKVEELTLASPVGANGIIFNPSLAGGSMMEPTPEMTGAFVGLKLGNNVSDIIRATKEGIAMNLKTALDLLKTYTEVEPPMLMVGGGAKSESWMRIFADVYDMKIEKTSIDQEAASIGVAALAFNALKLWKGYDMIDKIYNTEQIYVPSKDSAIYKNIKEKFDILVNQISELSY